MIVWAAAALAGVPAPSALCPTVPELPYGWRLDWGVGADKNEAEAITKAQDAARQRLLSAACQQVGALRCAAAERSIAVWGQPTYDKRQQSACAAMVIQVDALKSFEQDLAHLDADLATLATAAAATKGPLQLDPPVWSSGCVAGPLGHALAAQLRSELGQHGVQVVGGATRDPTASRLSVTLAPSAGRVTVSANLRAPGSPTEQLLPGFTFPLDLYGVSADETGHCAGRATLGLDAGDRLGADGLAVGLFVPTDDGRICEGQRAGAEVQVNRPARIEVWSVIHDGRAFLIGPDPALAPGGVLKASGRVLSFDALALEEAGDEMVVVLAVPASAPNAESSASGLRFSTRTMPCRLGQPWTPAMIPPGAAVAARTWTVVPEGTGKCGAWDGVESKEAVAASLAAIPVCR